MACFIMDHPWPASGRLLPHTDPRLPDERPDSFPDYLDLWHTSAAHLGPCDHASPWCCPSKISPARGTTWSRSQDIHLMAATMRPIGGPV
jgi:hypothetical protein